MALVHNKKLINEPQDVVTEFIEGLTDTYPNLQYLNGFPEVKVVLRADVLSTPYDKVAVISGGGSGHEPAHAGFVGEGMLTAAICGNVFASPTVNSILAGIRAVTGPKGCLLIVKNYAGDRLKFGLAAEEAKSEGYKVEVVIVGDDCALPPPAPRRGLAGTILVHKIAGAAAAAGLALSDVAAEAKLASKMVGTMGIALYICTMPGHGDSERIRPGKMELGLGIHGESDGSVTEIQPVDVIVSLVLQQILSLETNYVSITRGSRVVLMVNGLGATSTMELMIAAGKAVSRLQMEHELAIDRVYTGSFMTSLDTSGFSISVMKVNERILQRLDAATKAPYWPVGAGTHLPAKIPVPLPQSRSTKSDELPRRPKQLNSGGRILEAAVQAAANAIINLRDSLNQWDGKVGDGGCGSHMLRGATAILEDIKKHYPLNDAAETVNEIGCSIRKAMGGTSGILYSIFCTAAYTALKADSNSAVTPEKWVDALQAAVTAYSKYGGAKTGNRTLLDALVPALSVLKEHLDAGDDPVAAFILSSEAAMAGAESTKLMKTQAWFLYVSPDALSSNPDPGAMAAATWFRAAALAVKGINTKV